MFLEKPDLESLNRQYNCFDMHVHTKYSDTYTRPKMLLKRAIGLGINFAVTDHNEIRAVPEILRLNTDRVIVPGIEVGSQEGPHILFYFYDYLELKEFYAKHIRKYKNKNPFMMINRPAEDLLDAAEDYNCIAVSAHPDAPPVLGLARAIHKGYLSPQLFDRVDAIEVINGTVTEKMNLRAIKIGYELGKGFTGGSDSHTLQQLGKVVTCSDASDVDGLIRDILRHKTLVFGKNITARERIVPHAKAVSRHMRYGSSIKLRAKTMISKPLKHKIERLKTRALERRSRKS